MIAYACASPICDRYAKISEIAFDKREKPKNEKTKTKKEHGFRIEWRPISVLFNSFLWLVYVYTWLTVKITRSLYAFFGLYNTIQMQYI